MELSLHMNIKVSPRLLERWYRERQEIQKRPKSEQTTSKGKAFWDKRQLVKKINLNSLYGAIQTGCRFLDKRIGQSTILSRNIARLCS